MKQVHGTPWSEVVTKKTRTENIEILLKVADAVAFAHARGVVHRDLKPENVMLGDFGEVLVMDWGLAKVVDPEEGAETPAPSRHQKTKGVKTARDTSEGELSEDGDDVIDNRNV